MLSYCGSWHSDVSFYMAYGHMYFMSSHEEIGIPLSGRNILPCVGILDVV